MPAILAWIGSAVGWVAGTSLGKLVLGYLRDKLLGWAKAKLAKRAAKKAAIEEAKKSVEPLKKARTAEEIDAAAHDALDNM